MSAVDLDKISSDFDIPSDEDFEISSGEDLSEESDAENDGEDIEVAEDIAKIPVDGENLDQIPEGVEGSEDGGNEMTVDMNEDDEVGEEDENEDEDEDEDEDDEENRYKNLWNKAFDAINDKLDF